MHAKLQLNVLSLSDVRDNSDRMFVQEEYVAIQHLTGKQFTYDACCDDSAVNSHCNACSSPANSFLQSNVSGQHIWLHAPFAKLESFMKHYLKCCQSFEPSEVEEGGLSTENENIALPQATKHIIAENADMFADTPPGLPPERGVSHTINTEAHPPVCKQQYRLSPKERDEVQRQVQVLLDKKLIQPSRSAYSSPVIFVSKPDGSLRMCVDYRALTAQTVKDEYPIPRIDDLLDRLQGASVFSSLDLQSGYHQIRIAPDDVPKTAFRTPAGLFEFRVLSFGLTNAPAAFQREMNRIFSHLDFVLVYLDDTLIFSKDPEQHAKHLN